MTTTAAELGGAMRRAARGLVARLAADPARIPDELAGHFGATTTGERWVSESAYRFVPEAARAGLVLKEVTYTRGGKQFKRKQWVRGEPPAAKEKPAAKGKTPGPAVDPAEVYDRAGTSAKNSEVNAAIRHAAAMPKAGAAAAVRRAGHEPGSDPNRQLVELLHDRRSSQVRGLASGAGAAVDARNRAAFAPKNDEPLVTPGDVLGVKRKAAKAAGPGKPFVGANAAAASPPPATPAGRAVAGTYARAAAATDAEVAAAKAHLAGLPRDELARVASAVGMSGKVTPGDVIARIEDRRGSAVRGGLIDRPAAKEAAPPAKAPAAAKPAKPPEPKKVRKALDSLGVPHAHLSDAEVVVRLQTAFAPTPAAKAPAKAKAAPAAKKPATPKVAKAKKPAAPLPPKVEKTAKELEAHVAAAIAKPEKTLAAAEAKADGVLAKVASAHTPAEVAALARRVTGKAGRTLAANLHRLKAEMTAVERLAASQAV